MSTLENRPNTALLVVDVQTGVVRDHRDAAPAAAAIDRRRHGTVPRDGGRSRGDAVRLAYTDTTRRRRSGGYPLPPGARDRGLWLLGDRGERRRVVCWDHSAAGREVYGRFHTRDRSRMALKCGVCPNQAFIPVSDDAIDRHLRGSSSSQARAADYVPRGPTLSSTRRPLSSRHEIINRNACWRSHGKQKPLPAVAGGSTGAASFT